MQSVVCMKSSIVKRSVRPAGHKTSVSLEDDFLKALKEISRARQMTLSDLIHEIDERRQHGNLSSAIRLFVLKFYRSQASEKVGDSATSADAFGVVYGAPPLHHLIRPSKAQTEASYLRNVAARWRSAHIRRGHGSGFLSPRR